MTIPRILLIVAVLYLIWRVLGVFGRRRASEMAGAEDFSRFSARGRSRRSGSDGHRDQEGEELVACSGCGTHVPASRALASGDGLWFCDARCRADHEAEGGAAPRSR